MRLECMTFSKNNTVLKLQHNYKTIYMYNRHNDIVQ